MFFFEKILGCLSVYMFFSPRPDGVNGRVSHPFEEPLQHSGGDEESRASLGQGGGEHRQKGGGADAGLWVFV